MKNNYTTYFSQFQNLKAVVNLTRRRPDEEFTINGPESEGPYNSNLKPIKFLEIIKVAQNY